MNTPSWLAALRPVDLMSAAAALNPDAGPVWTEQSRWAVAEHHVSVGEDGRR